MMVIVAGVSSFVATTIAYRRLDKAPAAMKRSRKMTLMDLMKGRAHACYVVV